MKKLFLGILLVFCYSIFLPVSKSVSANQAITQQNAATTQKRLVTLRGRVVDARTNEPMGKVRVIASGTASGTEQSTTTDENGVFTLENLPAGRVEVYITTVNYGLVKKTITLNDTDNGETLIALNEDAAALTENVVVTTPPFEITDTNAPSEQTLNKRELQALSSVLLGDPVRAAQALPGVAANDDFRSEFAIRGAGFDRVGLYLDGILTENFVHTVQGGFPDTGSLSIINADTVSAVSLLSGAFPSQYGYRSAAVLDITTRDGNRVKPAGRLAASLSGLSGLVDGPFAHGRGSYLFAARKSYVGYLVRSINDKNQFTNNPPILNFADAQGKALYDFNSRNQIGFSLIYGTFNFDQNRDLNSLGINQVSRANTHNLLANIHWAFTPNARMFWQTRVFGLRTNFENTNRNVAVLQDGHRTQYGLRSDISFQSQSLHRNRVEAGLYLRSLRVDSTNRFFDFIDESPTSFASFNRHGGEQAFYAQDTWSNERLGLSLTGGGRIEHSGTTGETVFSPRVSLGWSIGPSWKIRGAAGRYYQFPDFEQMFGRLGNPALRSEHSTHYNASIERLLGNRTRLLAEVYDREDHGLFFSLSEPRLFQNELTFAQFNFENALRGHARGLELTLQRRSANKFTGWVSYSYSHTQLTDDPDGLRFVSDSDQSHTINVYSSYRFTDTWNVSGAWRYGSGQPVPGFYRQVGSGYFLSNDRNTARIPAYSRVDARVNKAFLFNKWKLTLSGEVINLLNRNNVRFAGFDGFGFDGQVFGHLDRVLPILPSAGVVLEF